MADPNAIEAWGRLVKLRDLMSTKVVSVELDDRLAVVKDIFDHMKFHHLLVVENKKLIGVVSDRDLLKAISPKLGTAAESEKDVATLNKRVHQIMTRSPLTLPPDASLGDAVNLFNTHRVSCIPIIDDDRTPVGILSWRDILRTLGEKLEG